MPCDVIAPTLISRRPGARIKTDRRDARQLAVLYRAGALTPIHIPTEEEEAARDLLRCREALLGDVVRARHRLSKFLLRHGRRFTAGTAWTQRHAAWLAGTGSIPASAGKPAQTSCCTRPTPLLTHPGDSIRPGGGPIHHPPSAGGYPGSAHPGPRNPARETISCRPAAPSPRSSLVSPALLPRPPKSPHIQRENGGEPRSDPGVRAPTRLGGGGGSPERTRLATNSGKCPAG